MIKKKWKKIVIIMIVIVISMSIGAYAAYVLTAEQVSYNKNGTTVTVKAALDDLYEKAPKYSVGDLVKLKNDTSGDKFYVLYEGKDTMEIFAYTNIDRDTCDKQVKLAYSSTACDFSSSQYWGSTAGLNFNNVTGYVAGDVMDKVNKYAQTKRTLGAISGRLLTKGEVENLTGVTDMTQWKTISNTKIRDMLDGVGNTSNTGSNNTTNGCFEYYWLGSGYESNNACLWCVYGRVARADVFRFNSSSFDGGVRPVLNVYKSQVEATS